MIFHRPALALVLVAGLSVVSTPTLAASGNNADMLLHNGRIYTENPQQPWVEAIAIKDGNILALGKDVDLLPLRSAQTEVVDLQGKMAMPGIVEAHSHPVWGGLKQLFQCNFPFTVTPEALADIIQACVARDDTAWIRGGQWDSSFFKTHNIESPRRWLDAVSGDKAITLTDDTGHNAWVNSKALALLKIDANFQPPSGMSIRREADGKTPMAYFTKETTTCAPSFRTGAKSNTWPPPTMPSSNRTAMALPASRTPMPAKPWSRPIMRWTPRRA